MNTWYRGYWIDHHGNGFTVFYEGDEIYFKTVKEAQNFINEVNPIEYSEEDLQEVEE